VGDLVGRDADGPGGRPWLTPRAKKVLELAVRESIRLHADRVGSEHFLLGMVREGEGGAAQILVQRLGLDLARVRQTVLDVIQEAPGEAPAG